MNRDARESGGLQGGLQIQANALRRWRWSPEGELISAPIRCKREQWYLARGFPRDTAELEYVDIHLRFLHDGEVISDRLVQLDALDEAEPGEPLLGWVQSPERATHMQIRIPKPTGVPSLKQLLLHPIAERDPKCHPLANIPRWSSYKPPFPLDRVVLPESLAELGELLEGIEVEIIKTPRTYRKLAAKIIGTACVIDPAWIRELGLGLADVERVAGACWMIVDLESFARLLNEEGAVPVKLVTHTCEYELMSARVEYADVPTRGFALQDVIPYSTLVGGTAFRMRVLHACRAWKKYADETGFAPLLESETPWEKKCGDVLSAARAIEMGELIITDLPWMVAGRYGRLLAPELAEHLLRMHLGCPLSDNVQYWHPWDKTHVIVRDLGDLPRRYPPLAAVRWLAAEQGVARLGLSLPALEESPRPRHLLLCSGRIDRQASHDGITPEPLAIFLRWLTREHQQRTRWARRYLKNTRVTWQFDSAEGLKYALHFDSAAGVADDPPDNTLILKSVPEADRRRAAFDACQSKNTIALPRGVGVFGDRSLDFQAELSGLLRRWIEKCGGGDVAR